MDREVNLRDYFKVIVKWRRLIAFNTAVITILTVVISLVLPKKYAAMATLLPPVEQPDLLGAGSLLEASGLGGMARMAGLPGAATTSDIFAKILKSRAVMAGVIEKCGLMDEYEAQTMEEALGKLGGVTSVEIYPEGIIAISVEARTAVLAADIANSYVDELDRFNRDVNMTRGKRNRIFIEERLLKVKDDLRAAEESLRVFQELHRTVSLDDEVRAAIEAVGSLKAEVIANEVRLGVLKQYATEENPQVRELGSEITQLNRQLREIEHGPKSEGSQNTKFGAGFSVPFARLPEVGLELARRMREAKIQETVFELLTQQYEQAKITEARDTPTIQVLDGAVPPDRRSSPQRRKLVMVGFIFSLFAGVGLSFFLEWVEKIQERPGEYKHWTGMGEELKTDMERIKRRFLRRRRGKT